MNRKTEKRAVKKKKVTPLYLTRKNYLIFGAGILVIILGYIALSKGPANSFWSLTLAPILLGIGYLVLVPAAILWRSAKARTEAGD